LDDYIGSDAEKDLFYNKIIMLETKLKKQAADFNELQDDLREANEKVLELETDIRDAKKKILEWVLKRILNRNCGEQEYEQKRLLRMREEEGLEPKEAECRRPAGPA
jgi:hypothetical protein